MSPRLLYRRIALAEVVSWALLLTGMVLKYGTGTTELGVRVFGMIHGVVFIGFVLITVVVGVNQRWTVRQGLLGLASAVPPFLTLWFERRMERAGTLEGGWRRGADSDATGHDDAPQTAAERVVAWLLARPAVAVTIGLVAVAALTGAALLAGPPVGSQG